MSIDALRKLLPPSVVAHVDTVYDLGLSAYKKIDEQYQLLQQQVQTEVVQKYIPEEWRPLANKVVQALPETLFCCSLAFSTGRAVASLFWVAHHIWVVSPFVKTLMNGQLEKETVDAAGKESLDRLQSLYERLKPAIMVSFVVGAIFCAVVGIVTMSVESLMLASGSLFLATLAYQAIKVESESASPNNHLCSKQEVGNDYVPAVPAGQPSAPPIEDIRR